MSTGDLFWQNLIFDFVYESCHAKECQFSQLFQKKNFKIPLNEGPTDIQTSFESILPKISDSFLHNLCDDSAFPKIHFFHNRQKLLVHSRRQKINFSSIGFLTSANRFLTFYKKFKGQYKTISTINP